MMRADLNDNLGVRFEHLQDSLTYFYLCHNHYGRSRESDYLLEMIASRRLSKPVFFELCCARHYNRGSHEAVLK